METEKRKVEEKNYLEDFESKYHANLQLLEQKLALQVTNIKTAKSEGSEGSPAKIPKMPYFNENNADVSQTFERYARAQTWEEEMWVVNLNALLTGRALDVYALNPQENAFYYAVL